jgi:type I restriction enzyme S subunit
VSVFTHETYGLDSPHLEWAKLSELCLQPGGIQTGPFGSQLHKRDYIPVGTPIITVEHLEENRIIHSDIPKVSDKDRERLKKFWLQTGDIVFSRVGSVDRRALVRETENGWLFSGRCLRVRPDPKKLDAGYLSYFLGLPAFKEYINRIAVGATMPSLNTKILSDVPIPLPPLPTQRRIAQILGRLDDKIGLNRRLNHTLEAMAQALFKHHFVDFGPYQDGEFVESELGLIPKGWEVGRVADWGDVITGKTPSTKNPANFGDDVPFIKIPDMHGKVFVTETTTSLSTKGANSQRKKFLPPMSVCVSCIATPGLVCLTSTESQTNQQINSIIPRKEKYAEFLYCQMSAFGEDIRRLGSGGTATLNLNKKDFSNIQVVIPSEGILDRFHRQVNPWFKQILNIKYENRKLAEIRDYLLPKLLSGEVGV